MSKGRSRRVPEEDPYHQWLDRDLQLFTAARAELEETLNRQRGDYLGVVLSIESTLSEIFVDLIATDDAGEQLLTEVFLDRVPGGDRLGLFEQLRKSLDIGAETKALSRDLSRVLGHRNLLAHRRSEVNWSGETISFKGRGDELTPEELSMWHEEALQTWLALLRLHAKLVVTRRPRRARAWMRPFLQRHAAESEK